MESPLPHQTLKIEQVMCLNDYRADNPYIRRGYQWYGIGMDDKLVVPDRHISKKLELTLWYNVRNEIATPMSFYIDPKGSKILALVLFHRSEDRVECMLYQIDRYGRVIRLTRELRDEYRLFVKFAIFDPSAALDLFDPKPHKLFTDAIVHGGEENKYVKRKSLEDTLQDVVNEHFGDKIREKNGVTPINLDISINSTIDTSVNLTPLSEIKAIFANIVSFKVEPELQTVTPNNILTYIDKQGKVYYTLARYDAKTNVVYDPE